MSARDEDLKDEELEEEEDDDEVTVDEDDEAALAQTAGDEEDSEEASLEELLSQRAAARRGTDESEDDDDIMALATEKSRVPEPLPTTVIPIKDQKEFVCTNCHLVKARVQLADAERGLCRDCV